MYNPTTDTWSALPEGGKPMQGGLAVWTGCDVVEMGVRIGDDRAMMRYDPVARTWTPAPDKPASWGVDGLVWTGDELLGFGQDASVVPGENRGYRLTK
jgi:hypothetical protein